MRFRWVEFRHRGEHLSGQRLGAARGGNSCISGELRDEAIECAWLFEQVGPA